MKPRGKGELFLWKDEHSLWYKKEEWVLFDSKKFTINNYRINVGQAFKEYMRRIEND